MAYHDPPLQRQGARAFDDEIKAKCTEVTRFVQMDVDRFCMTCRKSEDCIEMTHRIALDGGRVDTADDVGAGAQSRVHQLERAHAR